MGEVKRAQLLAAYGAKHERYCESGAESRFPFYGKDDGYEVDYFVEVGLEPGSICQATYDVSTLAPPLAAAVLFYRWKLERPWDEEATVELKFGQRHCRHPPRPDAWWRFWSPAAAADQLTPYADWLAWPGISEMKVF